MDFNLIGWIQRHGSDRLQSLLAAFGLEDVDVLDQAADELAGAAWRALEASGWMLPEPPRGWRGVRVLPTSQEGLEPLREALAAVLAGWPCLARLTALQAAYTNRQGKPLAQHPEVRVELTIGGRVRWGYWQRPTSPSPQDRQEGPQDLAGRPPGLGVVDSTSRAPGGSPRAS